MTIKNLNKYELLEVIGKGSYGTVYRALYSSLEVTRAVKVLHPLLASNTEFIDTFHDEARRAARLDHPHIVPVYDFDQDKGFFSFQ